MRILTLYLKEIDYKEVNGKDVEIKKISSTDKRIALTLRSLGHKVKLMEYKKSKLYSIKGKYDLIFNVCDGLENDNDFQEIPILKQIEKLNIPYTGNSSKVIKACYDKANIKRTLMKNNVRTPKFKIFKKCMPKPASLKFPLILKPLYTDGGVGIDDDSVVYNEKQFKKQLKFCLEDNKQPVLAEEYIDGRDFCVPVLGGKVLPPVECTFGDKAFIDRPKILTYDVKWATKSPDYKYSYFHIRNKIKKTFPAKLQKEVMNAAGNAFKAMGCTAYATIDIRVNNQGKAFVIEVNPNCWIDKISDSAKAAKSIGISYPEFINKIIKLRRKN